ncbi:alpha/beta fold hydrolase [Sciscionella marina]|uniref:alpha/beta fold hydrolase n=1 Tax=Sciscionella marina TaxID=508770 RepID=UPI0012F65C60|nr:alpha/beta hydrolase [Sciscionella marina]
MAYLSGGQDVWYTSAGEGAPIVLLPGLGFSGYYWKRQWALADRYQVITLDPRGQGHSGASLGPWTLSQVATDVRALILELDLREVTLVGWSMTSFVLFEYVRRYGNDRIKALCSVDMTPRNTLDPQWPHAIFGDLTMGKVVNVGGSIIDDQKAWFYGLSAACFAAGATVDEQLVADWTAEGLRTSTGALLAYWLDLARSDWREFVRTITVPTLLCHGTRSQAVPTDVGAWLRDAMPNATLTRFEHSGHVPFWEEAEAFNTHLDAFLTSVPVTPVMR